MHGMDPDEELAYWRERAKKAEAEVVNLRSCMDGWVSNWKQQTAEVARLREAWADDRDDLLDQIATLSGEKRGG